MSFNVPEEKWKSPLVDWGKNHQDPNLAFTLVAQNERAKQMWADPHNSSRYIPASFTRNPKDRSIRKKTPFLTDSESDDDQPRLKRKKETEPALQFLFNDRPMDFKKGYVLGSCDESCDALLGDPGGYISQKMLAFTYNKHHQLVMNVTSDNPTSVTFNNQKKARRRRFSWIFPRGQRIIRVKVAGVLEFDVVLPEYGRNKDQFHHNCESFLSSAAWGLPLFDSLEADSITATGQASGTSSPQDSFYLRGKILGSGSYGDVRKVLRMPDGKIFAAKSFKFQDSSFRQEVDMLKKVCKTFHKNIIQFVEEWHGDYKPLLIMEYVAGGNLLGQMRMRMQVGEIANLANQTLAALIFLHDQGVMHRDIKPGNILCVAQNHYKLADFGVSKDVAPSLLSKQGTAEYMAPEVHDLAPYSYPADMWSLGVVLFECMEALPDGRPGADGRKWCERVFSKFILYYDRNIKRPPYWKGKETIELILFIKEALLHMDPDERLSARECVENYHHLLENVGDGEDWDTGIGAKTPTQAHPSGSFPPASLNTSEDDEAGEESSSTVRWNGEGTPEEGREPRDFQNEDKSAVTTHSSAGTSFRGSFFQSPPSFGGGPISNPSRDILDFPSIAEGTTYDPGVAHLPSVGTGILYDPAHVFASVPSMSETGTLTRSISEGSIKRRRDSNTSSEGDENDGSVTSSRRASYRPGNEVAAAGSGDGLVSHPSVVRITSSTQSHKRSKSAA